MGSFIESHTIMKIAILLILIILISYTFTFAQKPKVLKEQGIKKLSVFIGKWKSETLVNGKSQGTAAVSTCRWSANGNYMIADQMITNGKNKTNNLSIYSYVPEKDRYKLSLVGVPGLAPFAIDIACKGDELIYISSYMDNGRKVYNRTLNDFISPGYYTFKVQSSTDSLNWTTSMEGRSTKIGN